jgi:hypothetical protein
MDLSGYDAFMSGKLKDFALPDSAMEESLKELDGLPRPAKG